MEFADDLDDEGDSGKSIEKDKGGEQLLSLKNNPQAQETVRGRVVGIVKREWRPTVAMVQEDDTKGSFHLAVPVNENIPKIRISCSNVDEIIGNRIVVVIDKWAIHSQYPDGHIISKLGKAGEVNTEIDTLLIEHGIAASQQDLAFPQVVMDDLPKSWDAVAEKDRRDIRDRVVFSIDPIGSQDIDDALSIEKTKTGYELGVHIADASYFVKPGNKIDEEAKKRTSTIYLPDRRFNMIPELLSEQLCSLRGGKDRYAVSVLWNLDNKYQVKDIWFGRTLINSKCEMSYEFAQSLLDENEAYQKELMNNSDSAKDTTLQYITVANVSKDMVSVLKSRVEMLTALMRHFRGIRLNNGGLQLESVEVKFKYKQNQIYEIEPKKKLEIHSVIEEAMIMANVAVAERIFQHFNKTSLLRSHGFPTQERFDTLKLMAESVGIGIDTESNLKLAGSLARAEKIARDKLHDGSVAKLLKSITVLAMQEAKYVCSGNDQQFVSGNKGGDASTTAGGG
ncbi:DIS3-like exonuclease 1 [Zancudomyces culisetae]|uniref:DIS3-like exonuclease 1 n=1 Tax=Zancudomyces culisetae TaxID=1213189 RepID=A0A1R1PCR0_ZANCU|nr:DIS3-like exonuclease 1 [Zancudomyces culisetae]|eukprot:OMH78765.1 DIS3-like exonuclease 1 [Zancudomyces culisetae]